MNSRRTRIPIQVKPTPQRSRHPSPGMVMDAPPPVIEAEAVMPSLPEEPEEQPSPLEEELAQWQDRALRLEAEIDNFRKRQRRLAEDRVTAERERLLRAFLPVADDLNRALSIDNTDVQSLRQGVELTLQSLMRVLDQEGVEHVPAEGEHFDPCWHEAIGTMPCKEAAVELDTIVEVIQPGYQLGERLLRPAQVIVATS